MKNALLLLMLLSLSTRCFCWGFFAHQRINYYAVFLLPPEMMALYKPHLSYISQHAVDPDKRRYAVAAEGPRHFIDIDHYGPYPFDSLPRRWEQAVARYTEDSLQRQGIAPWWLQIMLRRLTEAFRQKNESKILKLSAEIGHYMADIHVPLHACSNHNGQLTNQTGIHAFWESRIPELLADKNWNFFVGPAVYLQNPTAFIWDRVLESAAAADTVLRCERELSARFPADAKFAFENRNGLVIRQYSAAYAKAYDQLLHGMVERRMRQAIFAVASLWYTAWVNAGQPDLTHLSGKEFSEEDRKEMETLDAAWKKAAPAGLTDHAE